MRASRERFGGVLEDAERLRDVARREDERRPEADAARARAAALDAAPCAERSSSRRCVAGVPRVDRGERARARARLESTPGTSLASSCEAPRRGDRPSSRALLEELVALDDLDDDLELRERAADRRGTC